MSRAKTTAIWGAVALALVIPVTLAALSPQLQWRGPVYIAAGFAGVIGLGLLLVQPMLAAGLLPGLNPASARRLHQTSGVLLLACVIIHVAALWITSPPDVIDVLLIRSPTPFSIWGLLAMWAVFAAAAIALMRRRVPPKVWRTGHRILAVITATGTILHALQIEGTMETTSKGALCIAVAIATFLALRTDRLWRR